MAACTPHHETTAPAIADYALIGDCRTAALVSCDGSIDWLCLPNFSSTSVFARLLDPRGGRFSLHPTLPFTSRRRYIDGTAVLETTFETDGGSARIFDCLPVVDGIRQMRPMREVLRIVEGVRGTIFLCFHRSASGLCEACTQPQTSRPARLVLCVAQRNLERPDRYRACSGKLHSLRHVLRRPGAAPLFQPFLLPKRTSHHTAVGRDSGWTSRKYRRVVARLVVSNKI